MTLPGAVAAAPIADEEQIYIPIMGRSAPVVAQHAGGTAYRGPASRRPRRPPQGTGPQSGPYDVAQDPVPPPVIRTKSAQATL